MKRRWILFGSLVVLCLASAGCSLTGDESVALTNLEPALSPDGQRIAYETAVEDRLRLFIRNLAAGETEQLPGGAYDDFSPAWSPDGASLVFASNREKDNLDIYTLNLATREVRRLTTDSARDMYPTWAADGRIYFNSDRTKTWQIYSILPDGTGLVLVAASGTP